MKVTETLALLCLAASARSIFIEPRQPGAAVRSLAERLTRLPCHYQEEDGEKVVQVTWFKMFQDGGKDQIITAHFESGQTEFGRYSGRMAFESGRPTENSALVISSTELRDEGAYLCRISTFPNGVFERKIALTVWSLPISSLDPEVLAEGQSFRVAATCRAVGRPPPRLSWDTDLPGQSRNRSGEGGSVSSSFSLHPLRSMDGKRLDCLVWHPGLDQPRRIRNLLEVHYPPDATISTSAKEWFVGLEGAEMMCDGGGNPKPQNITWTWRGGALPDGARAAGGKLTFGRALNSNDSGVYQCLARNGVGAARTDYQLNIAERSTQNIQLNDRLLIIICASAAAAAVLILVVIILLVNRHHRRKNRKLEMQLSEKREEIDTLSRQASFRRLNSVSTDPRGPTENSSLLRLDSRMKNSQVSLERPAFRGSQSTLCEKWGQLAGTELDELGRPVIWTHVADGAHKEDARRKVESYLESSSMSMDSGLPSSLVPLKVQPDERDGPEAPESDGALEIRAGREPPPPPPPEGEEDDDNSSYRLSEALTNHFYYSNGLLRPRPHSNAILLHPQGQIV